MITILDLYNIVGNKIANETGKAIIRNNFPPQIAEQMCSAIDGQERAEHFQCLLKEYNIVKSFAELEQMTHDEYYYKALANGRKMSVEDIARSGGASESMIEYIREDMAINKALMS